MAAGATRKAKSTGARGRATTKSRGPLEAAPRKQARKAKTVKAPAKKAVPSKALTAKQNSSSDELTLLKEQNDALKAELELARAKVEQLEKLNRDVANRIDWIIDSLQGLMPKQ